MSFKVDLLRMLPEWTRSPELPVIAVKAKDAKEKADARKNRPKL